MSQRQTQHEERSIQMIDTLQRQVDGHAKITSKLKQQVSGLRDSNNKLQQQVSGLRDSNNKLQQQVSSLRGTIAKLTVIISDTKTFSAQVESKSALAQCKRMHLLFKYYHYYYYCSCSNTRFNIVCCCVLDCFTREVAFDPNFKHNKIKLPSRTSCVLASGRGAVLGDVCLDNKGVQFYYWVRHVMKWRLLCLLLMCSSC